MQLLMHLVPDAVSGTARQLAAVLLLCGFRCVSMKKPFLCKSYNYDTSQTQCAWVGISLCSREETVSS